MFAMPTSLAQTCYCTMVAGEIRYGCCAFFVVLRKDSQHDQVTIQFDVGGRAGRCDIRRLCIDRWGRCWRKPRGTQPLAGTAIATGRLLRLTVPTMPLSSPSLASKSVVPH